MSKQQHKGNTALDWLQLAGELLKGLAIFAGAIQGIRIIVKLIEQNPELAKGVGLSLLALFVVVILSSGKKKDNSGLSDRG